MTDRLYSQSVGTQIAMEVGEEMMRGMPTCSKHEWRHRGKKSRWAFVRISVSVRWAYVRPVGCSTPTRLSISKGRNDSFCVSTRTRTLFPSDTVSPTSAWSGYSFSSVELDPFTQLLMTLTLPVIEVVQKWNYTVTDSFSVGLYSIMLKFCVILHA